MADTILQSESAPATPPKLALELKALHDRVRRMEALLRGAESILSSIRYDGELCFTPADGTSVDRHRRAYQMIEFIGEQFERWDQDEKGLDVPSDDIWVLMDKAQRGRLIRYGEPVPEPVA